MKLKLFFINALFLALLTTSIATVCAMNGDNHHGNGIENGQEIRKRAFLQQKLPKKLQALRQQLAQLAPLQQTLNDLAIAQEQALKDNNSNPETLQQNVEFYHMQLADQLKELGLLNFTQPEEVVAYIQNIERKITKTMNKLNALNQQAPNSYPQGQETKTQPTEQIMQQQEEQNFATIELEKDLEPNIECKWPSFDSETESNIQSTKQTKKIRFSQPQKTNSLEDQSNSNKQQEYLPRKIKLERNLKITPTSPNKQQKDLRHGENEIEIELENDLEPTPISPSKKPKKLAPTFCIQDLPVEMVEQIIICTQSTSARDFFYSLHNLAITNKDFKKIFLPCIPSLNDVREMRRKKKRIGFYGVSLNMPLGCVLAALPELNLTQHPILFGSHWCNHRHPDTNGTALHVAAYFHKIDFFETLDFGKNGTDLNCLDNQNNTPLHIAVQQYNFEIVQFLLNHGANPNILNDEGKTPLDFERKGSETFTLLIQNGAQKGTDLTNPYVDQQLIYAAQHNDIETIRNLLNQGIININAHDNDGKTALMHAVKKGNREIVQALIQAGVNVYIRHSTRYKTALNYAIGHRDLELALQLIHAGANVRTQGSLYLAQALKKKLFLIVPTLIHAGAKINSRDNKRKTALIYAVDYRLPKFVKILIRAGANVKINEDYFFWPSKTAFEYAVDHGDLEIVQELIHAGVNVNKKLVGDDSSSTPLMHSLRKHYFKIAQKLIHAGAKVNLKNRQGKTALMYAVRSKAPLKIIQKLIHAGAKVNAKNNKGKTALMYTTLENDHSKIALTLIQNGANVNELSITERLFYQVYQLFNDKK